MTGQQVRVWDLPLRLFHWLLAAAIAVLMVSGNVGGLLLHWHGKIGLAVVGMLAFRVVWGFVGSTHSRFAEFFPTPRKIRRHLSSSWTGVGHNPLGALSVLAMLAVIASQAVSGLFVNDDIAYHGPLFDRVGEATSAVLTGYHRLAGKILLVLIALHLAAIAFYHLVKKRNLIRPMLTGLVDVERIDEHRITGGGRKALALAVMLAALLLYGLAYYGDAPPPAVAAPVW